jgi:hypothetical protein
MVTNPKQHSAETRSKQASNEARSKPNPIGASMPYDFSAKNLTPYASLSRLSFSCILFVHEACSCNQLYFSQLLYFGYNIRQTFPDLSRY